MKKTGKTFNEKNVIMNILNFGKNNSRWMTTREIVGVANAMGWTTPMDDPNRKASSHPFSKILSMMTDIANETYFTPGVVCRKGSGKGKKTEYTIA